MLFQHPNRSGRSRFGSSCFVVFLVQWMMAPFASSSSSSNPLESPRFPPSRRSLLLLDVDNTLYSERVAGVEAQIVRMTHSYCQDVLDIDTEEADELFRRYGSTVEGLRRTIWKDLPQVELEVHLDGFYRAVYNGVDVSSILPSQACPESSAFSTGYTHGKDQGDTRLVRQLLMNWKPEYLSVGIASNSPSWHVGKVLRALGLAKLVELDDFVGLYTPDRLQSYPTKHEPESFFAASGGYESNHLAANFHSVSFFDDSLHNLRCLKKAFPTLVQRGYHISHVHDQDVSLEDEDRNPKATLVQALLQEAGLVDPSFQLDQVKYLEAKNKVDRQSIHVDTWNLVIAQLRDAMNNLQRRQRQDGHGAHEKGDNRGNIHDNNHDKSPSSSDLWIVDLGAGLLSILDLLLHGDDDCGLEPLLRSSTDGMLSSSAAITTNIQYTAYESNKELYEACHVRLLSWGFHVFQNSALENENGNSSYYQHNNRNVNVRLVLQDFAQESTPPPGKPSRSPDLIVGCCFADLLDPHRLVPDLVRTFQLLDPTPPNGTLLYFPITFAGITQFVPARPFEFIGGADNGNCGNRIGGPIPSDTVAFRSYATALEDKLGHNLDPLLLRDVMEAYGAKLQANSPSDWKIDPQEHPYLYETMLYFFGSTGGPQLISDGGWDAAAWIRRAREQSPSIQVTNRDLLFRITKAMAQKVTPSSEGDQTFNKDTCDDKIREILFTEPFKVTSTTKDIPRELGHRQILIKTTHSLISSGTELKIFKGIFDDDAALDVNIKDMEGERMAYPLSYGYCLVGHVVGCGSEVPREDYMGRMVFAFSPHASHVVTDMDAIQFIPGGIDGRDAVFMPSVETALSLVHDAHVRLGENVAVHGQGLIGILVTALLSRSIGGSQRGAGASSLGGKFGTITVFDMIPDRLAMASEMGASQALFPGGSDVPFDFDVSIEVSGNARALQSAIDHTRDGGRVIVGSWYGNSDVSLKLGIDFHRSHKTIQTSQVSEIPASLSRLWSKERRFALTWDLVRQIRPSRLLTKMVSLDEAQSAYEALDKGTEIAVAFAYSSTKH